MKYNIIKLSLLAFATATLCFSCKEDTSDLPFTVDSSTVKDKVGPDGGEKIIDITASGKWTASTDATWLQMSPVSGEGPTKCRLKIDSAILANQDRTAVINIISEGQSRPIEFKVSQSGYERYIKLAETFIEIPEYEDEGKRTFEVEVTTNVPFEIKKVADSWVTWKPIKIDPMLNRGARPRTFKLKFEWDVNNRPDHRETIVELNPTTSEELQQIDKLTVKQLPAELIVPSVRGDSLSIVGIYRALKLSLNATEKMMNWYGVILWDATDKEVKADPTLLGRVKSLIIPNGASTNIGIPFEIQYLTALEELIMVGLGNYHIKNFKSGPYIAELKQLKRLKLTAWGITELEPSFANLSNLEILDLSSNRLDNIPPVLTPVNFPKLVYLNLQANKGWVSGGIYDLNISTAPRTEWKGLYLASQTATNNARLKEIFKWEKLEYLKLSNNFMQGALPALTSAADGLPKYTASDKYWYYDYNKRDTVWQPIPPQMVNKIKVLPNCAFGMSLNLNYFSGAIPDWILYHPHLMKWDAGTLIFNQEPYLNSSGVMPGFTNIPVNLEYYYAIYPEQRDN